MNVNEWLFESAKSIFWSMLDFLPSLKLFPPFFLFFKIECACNVDSTWRMEWMDLCSDVKVDPPKKILMDVPGVSGKQRSRPDTWLVPWWMDPVAGAWCYWTRAPSGGWRVNNCIYNKGKKNSTRIFLVDYHPGDFSKKSINYHHLWRLVQWSLF